MGNFFVLFGVSMETFPRQFCSGKLRHGPQFALICSLLLAPFLFKDFLLFSGRVESRDNICIIENHLIDRNQTCIYLAKSHLFTA